MGNNDEYIKMYELYKTISNIGIGVLEQYLNSKDINDLLLLNYYLTYNKLNKNDDYKNKLISDILVCNVQSRVDIGLSRD